VRKDLRITPRERDPADLRRLAKALIAQVRVQTTKAAADHHANEDEDDHGEP